MEAWVQLITQGGVCAVLGLWVWVLRESWKDERDDRRTLQSERDALLERVLKGLHDSETAIKASTDANRSTERVVAGLRDLLITGGRTPHE